MKLHLLLSAIFIFSFQLMWSQTSVFHENFELPLGADSVSSLGSPAWAINTSYSAQGVQSMHNKTSLVLADTLSMVTNSFSTIGLSQVILNFSHICKVSYFDKAEVFVSIDNGSNWTKLTSSSYLGTANFATSANSFNANGYGLLWQPAFDTVVPNNSWWRTEAFDISSIAGNQANVKVRFAISNGLPSNPGPKNNYGWLIDDINIVAATSELIPPTVSMYVSPTDTVFGSSAINIKAKVYDPSGIDTVYLVYSVNGGINDTLGMIKNLLDTFSVSIPFPGFGRTVCYKVIAKDGSTAHNLGFYPANGCKSFNCKYNVGSVATIGNGTLTTTAFFYAATYPDLRNQLLFTASDLITGGAVSGGNISSIAFNFSTANTSIYNGFTIQVRNTTESTLSALDLSTDFITVYSGNFASTATGWQTINFTTPFPWDGVSNLLFNFCYNNSATGTSSAIYYTTSTGTKRRYAYSSTATSDGCALTTPVTSTTTMPNTRITISSPAALSRDAGFGQLISPSGSVQANNNTPVNVSIKNFGNDTLFTTTVNWKVDGVLKTPFSWTGQLLKDSLSASITLGNINLPVGNHSLEVWTTLPNGLSDLNWGNDNFVYNFYACSSVFSGTYTVGAVGSDFTTISNALLAMNQCGISGPVVLNVDTGIYNEQITIPSIIGSNATNTVTIKSINGDSINTILQYDAIAASDNYVVKLNGTSNIIIKGFTLKALDLNYSRVVILSGNENNITLQSNILIGTETANIDSNQFLFSNYNGNVYNGINLIANRFNFGRFAINFINSSTLPATNVVMKFNYLFNQSAKPMNLGGVVGIDFGYNKLFSDATKTGNGGIFTSNLSGQWKFYNNSMINLGGVRIWEGWVNSGVGVGQEALVFNNYLYGAASTLSYVFDGGGTYTYVKFLNNTFVGNPTNVLVNLNNYYGCNNFVTFKNNILSSTSKLLHVAPSATSGSPICSANFANYTFDYNDYYTTSATLATFNGTTCSNLAALKTATTQETHSVSIIPQFISPQDFHITNFALKGVGTPVPEVTIDMDGQSRSLTAPDPGCDELILYSNDAGITSMIQTTICPGNSNVEVKLKNFGSNALVSATVNWSVNGVVQTPVNLTGNMASLADTILNLGTYNFLNTTTYTLKYWTSVPNATSDGNVQNDTLTISNFHTSLTGIYTVGGVGADFISPAAAITALNTYGVCGPTVLNINPGTYTGRLTIGSYVGMSPVNTLTIKSLNNDTSAIITDSATATTNNWIINLNGAKYVTIQSLKLVAKYHATYGTCLLIGNSSKYNTVIGNSFVGVQSTSTATSQAVIFSTDINSKANNIIGNSLYNGSIGVYMVGSSTTSRMDSIYVYKNIIRDYYQNGIQINYSNSPVIDSNVIVTATAGASVARTGINFNYGYDQVKITRNSIDVSNSTSLIGVLFGNGTATITTKSLIANNFVTLVNATGTTAYGLRIYPASYVVIANNSLYVTGTSLTETRGINCVGGSFNEVINNNVVSNNYPCFYEGTAVTYSDYNNFFSTANRYAYFPGSYQNYTTQAALSAASQKDSNTVSVDPLFYSNTNLHTLAGSLNGVAKVLPQVTVDIDGELRSLTSPDIGADEFIASPNDLNAFLILTPASACNLSNEETITLKVKNVGSADANGGYSISYQIKGNPTVVTEPISDTIIAGYSKNFAFATKADMTIGTLVKDSVFQVKAWVNWATDPVHINDTTNAAITSGYKPAPPATNSFIANYATTPIITTTATDTLFWYANASSIIPLGFGKFFTTPILYDTTQFWAAAKSLTGMACESSKVPVTVNIINFPAIDAGITAITDPTTNIPSKINHSLKVNLKNYGMTPLTSAKIIYSLNGTITDTLDWVGNLTHGSVANVEVDSLYLAGGVYALKVWTSIPNSVVDPFNYNDTSNFSFNACMQGTYTIGKTPNVTYDFGTFLAANTALQAAGVCGNVTFLVDTGVYEERMFWNPIVGAGPNARITFQSMNGDSTSATLRFTLSSAAAWAMKFIGADYFTFRNLKLSVSNSITYGRIMEFDGGANYNTFENCILEGVAAASQSNYMAIVFSNAGNNNFNTFNNCYFKDGAYAVYFYGSSTNIMKGNSVTNCTIKNTSYYTLYYYYQDSMNIIGNKIESSNLVSYGYGIYSSYGSNFNISKNRIIGKPTSYFYATYITYSTGSPTNRNIISNNMISVPGNSSTVYGFGLYIYSSAYTDVLYNTVNLPNNANGNRGLYYYNGTDVDIRNNNISVGKGVAAFFSGTTGLGALNYNNYYSGGDTLTYWTSVRNSLAAHQAGSGLDLNSTSVLPPFTSNIDLHLLSTNLSAKGIYTSKVTVDIDGEQRGAVPTIGADEVPLKAIDGGVSAVLVPGSNTFEYDTIYPKIIVCNYGTDTLYSIPLSYSVNSGPAITFTYNDTVIKYGCDTVALPYFLSPAGNSSICAKTQILLDSNTFNDQTCKNFFGTPSYDAAARRVLKINDGCGLTTDSVRLVIKNNGGIKINGGLTASYQVNNLPVITETVNDSILINDSITYKFTIPINLAVTTSDNIFNIKAWVNLVSDNVKYNDTTLSSVKSFHTPPAPTVANVTIPYGTSTTITALSPTNDSIIWYDSAYNGTKLHEGPTYTTSTMYATDTFYTESMSGGMGGVAILGTSASTTSIIGLTPYSSYYEGARSQYLIRASELVAQGISSGKINSVTFTVTAASAYVMNDFSIKLGQTTATAMSGAYITPTNGFTTVYSNVSEPVVSVGSKTYTFTTPVIWDGSSNLVFDICHDNDISGTCAACYGTSGTVAYSITPFNSVFGSYADNVQSCGVAPVSSLSATYYTYRPNMVLNILPNGCTSSRSALIVNVANQSPIDAGLISIISPITGIYMTNAETVKVQIKNFGNTPLSNFQVSYKINNNAVVTENVGTTINPQDSFVYTFTTNAPMGIVGTTYNFKAWTTKAGDATALNDTLSSIVSHLIPSYCIGAPTSTSYEDLTNVTLNNLNNTSAAVGSTYTDFTNISPVILSPGASYPISISSNFAPGFTTQYTCWINVFIDFNKDGIFDAATENVFASTTTSFNTVTGTVSIPALAKTGQTRMRVCFRESGTQANTGPCGTWSWGETEDYDVFVMPLISQDISIDKFISPSSSVTMSGITQDIIAKVTNIGSDTIMPNTLSVGYVLNGNTIISQIFADTLLLGDTAWVTFNAISFNAGINTLCVKATLPGDTNLFNNEKCKTIFGETQVSIPFTDNFDNSGIWYNADTVWQKGAPTKTTISTAHSAPNVWITRLVGNYPNSTNVKLNSPWFDFSILGPGDTASLKFWYIVNTELTNDGAKIEYSVDGITWINLSYFGDTLATNGYNTNSNLFSGTGAWKQFSKQLDPSVFNTGVPVQFRMLFSSNATNNTYDGFAFDDFSINLPIKPIDALLDSIISPVSSVVYGTQQTVKVRIKNVGLNTLTSIPLYYYDDLGNMVTDTFTGSIAPGQLATHTFATTFAPTTASLTMNLCARVNAINDGWIPNDSLCYTLSIKSPAKDAGVISIHTPATDTTYLGHLQTVKVRIKNYGTTAITAMDVQYKAGFLTQVIEPWTGNLLPDSTLEFTFATKYAPQPAWYQLCSKTILPNDGKPVNDNICANHFGGVDPNDGVDETWNSMFKLEQNKPNPATGITSIYFETPAYGKVKFTLIDLVGQVLEIQDISVEPGRHQIELDAKKLTSGIYYYSVEQDGHRLVKKMVVTQ